MAPVIDKNVTFTKVNASPTGMWIMAGLVSLMVLVVALFSFINFDPYVSQVLGLEGNAERGRAIFQANCAVCHGVQGDGYIGPSLRGVAQRKSQGHIVRQVVSGQTPPMPQFQPNPQEMADLLDYLKTV
ncbi:cytochrome c [Synechocystis sp. CS-94]|nr:cytochrome c [Synechocystis sp. CS-94]CAA57910.1 c-type cytochrome [Synechocystis sp. PCC 6714]